MHGAREPVPAPAALEALFPRQAWKAGEDYVGLGRLRRLIRADGRLAGEVLGQTGDYWATLGPDGPACSFCRGACRHAAALAVAWIRDPQAFQDVRLLVKAYLAAPAPDPLVDGLLENNVLKALETFTEGVFIPPFDAEEHLVRYAALPAAEKVRALERLVAQEAAPPTVLVRALALTADLPFPPMARLTLKASGPAFDALALWLAGRAEDADLDAFLDQVLSLLYEDRPGGGPILRKAARVLALAPGGEAFLPWLAQEAEEDSSLALDVARFLLAAGRPRQALRTLERALVRPEEQARPSLLRLAIRAAEAAGSPREGALRLQALALGETGEIQVLTTRFPELLKDEGPVLLERIPAAHGDARASLALALGRSEDAFRIARTSALSFSVLRRLAALARRLGEDPSLFLTTGLLPKERRRFQALARADGGDGPAERRRTKGEN